MLKVSIIIPAYNSALFIKRALDSVLSQTWADWELLVVDDCSTDGTADIVASYAQKDTRIRLLHTEKNSGAPALPKNIGIENARGEYIAFLDHDDEWLPMKLEKQLQVFENSKDEKLGLVSCYIYIRDNETGKIKSKRKNFQKKINNALLQYNFLVTSSCIVVKKEVFEKIGKFDINFSVSDDWDMWLRIIKNGYRVTVEPSYLVNYFTHDKNLSGSSNIDKQFEEFKILKDKNNEEPFKMKEHWFLSYYYFVKKQYKLSRKYYWELLFFTKVSFCVRFKIFAYIILTFVPAFENLFKSIWRKLR